MYENEHSSDLNVPILWTLVWLRALAWCTLQYSAEDFVFLPLLTNFCWESNALLYSMANVWAHGMDSENMWFIWNISSSSYVCVCVCVCVLSELFQVLCITFGIRPDCSSPKAMRIRTPVKPYISKRCNFIYRKSTSTPSSCRSSN